MKLLSLPLGSAVAYGLALVVSTPAFAQEESAAADPAPLDVSASSAAQGKRLTQERAFLSHADDLVLADGQRVRYGVTVGTQPVWNDEGEEIASVFYSYYRRLELTAEDSFTRPLTFSFNGGPGSASVWMHMAYTGPKLLSIDDEGYPVLPYGITDNPHSILDVTDIVYVDPVNTGFSRIVGDADRSQFFGVNEDVAYLAEWIQNFVSREKRWRSPKFLIGESYGTTRVSGLAAKLQDSNWMYVNGVVLVSPTGLGIDRDGPVRDAIHLPYYAATAWYHKVLEPSLQQRDLEDLLPEVEAFTLDQLLPALARGGSLPAAQRSAIAKAYARYSALSEKVVLEHSLAVPTSFYWKELLRDQGRTVGRLDSRYRGIDQTDAGTRPDFDPAMAAWNHAFAPAINHYLRDVIGWKTELQYWVFGSVHPWNRDGDETGSQLQRALAKNPFLHVMVQSGYFDGGTDYFSAKYTMWNLDPAGRFQDRMSFKGYRSGHMMYLRKPDLKTANDDIRAFIQKAIPPAGQPAKH